MERGSLRCIVTPRQRNMIPAAASICADNGCYGKGWPGVDQWIAWLSVLPANRVDFAVAPDVVGDAAATLARSLPLLPVIRALGLPAAFVAQDGLESLPIPWDEFDTLFIGGSTAWKLGPECRGIVATARQLGKPVHMGRVNSLRRLQYAADIGCLSADGTYLSYGPDVNLPRLLSWLRAVNHPRLWVIE